MSRLVTLSQLRTDIANQADVTVGATTRYTPTLLNRLINQSIQRFRERVSSEGMAHFLVAATGTLTAGATSPYSFSELDLSAASPSIVRTYGVDITVNGTVISLAHRPFTERNDYGTPSSTSVPRVWMHIQTRKIAIAPAPDSAYAYAVWYLPVLADLSADGDTFDGVAGWEDYVTADVCLKLVSRDQYPAAYALFAQNLESTWRDILRGASKVTAAGGANVGRDTFRGGAHIGRRDIAVVGAGGGTPATHSVTNAMLAEIPEETIKGRARGAGYGDVQNLTPGQAAGAVSVFSGFAAGLVPTGAGNSSTFLANDGQWRAPSVGGSVSGLTLSQLQNFSSPRVLGRFTVGTGAAEQLTGQQVASMVGNFTGAAHGLVPMPTGGFGAGLFLRDDATWAAPAAGGGGGPTMLAAGPAQAVQYNGGSGLAGASGLLFAPETGLALNGNMRIPTGIMLLGATGVDAAPVGWIGAYSGALNFGIGTGTLDPAFTIETPPDSSGSVRFRTADMRGAGAPRTLFSSNRSIASGNINLLFGSNDSSATTLWSRHQTLIRGAGPTGFIQGALGTNVTEAFAARPGHHTWSVSGAQKLGLDNDGLSVWGQLGVQRLAHSASNDKLGAWTASGFANVATGIQISASGTSLELGSTGPVLTASGIDMRSGAIANYAPSAVTLAQLAPIPATTILGRTSPSGIPEALTPSAVATMMPLFNDVHKGLVPGSSGGTTNFLRADGTWNAPPAAGTPTGIQLAQLAAIPATTILGRTSPSGIPQALTPSAVATMMPLFNDVHKGLVPGSSGGTTNFLRADGTWATPPGGAGGGGPTMLAAGPALAIQYNGGSGFAGASGFLFSGSGAQLAHDLSMPTGALRFGASGIATAGDIRHPYGREMLSYRSQANDGNVRALRGGAVNNDLWVGDTASGADLTLFAHSQITLAPGGSTEYVATASGLSVTDNALVATSDFKFRTAAQQLAALDANHLGLGAGLRLGAPQLAHSATTDKLATWTASGFANVATGITLGASGYSLSVGSGGPVLHGSGADFRSSVIENVKRINGLDGIKIYGFVSGGGSASGSQNMLAASGTAFIIPDSVTAGQVFNFVSSGAATGDLIMLENRSGITHKANNVGTPSAFMSNVVPSGGTSFRFASGAWSVLNHVQFG